MVLALVVLVQAALVAAAAAEHNPHRDLVPGNPAVAAAAAVCNLSPNPDWKAQDDYKAARTDIPICLYWTFLTSKLYQTKVVIRITPARNSSPPSTFKTAVTELYQPPGH